MQEIDVSIKATLHHHDSTWDLPLQEPQVYTEVKLPQHKKNWAEDVSAAEVSSQADWREQTAKTQYGLQNLNKASLSLPSSSLPWRITRMGQLSI